MKLDPPIASPGDVTEIAVSPTGRRASFGVPSVGASRRRYAEPEDWERGRVKAVSREAGARQRAP
jgi:hypothetical protein